MIQNENLHRSLTYYSFSQLLWHIFWNSLNFIACLQNVVTHPKHLIHASKPSYRVSHLAKATKI